MANPIICERDFTTPGGLKGTKHLYWCPGCDALHGVAIRPAIDSKGGGWAFSGTLEKPTYAPSQLTTSVRKVRGKPKEHRCHTFIKGGMIEFLRDSTHELAGKTVPMVPLPKWVFRRED